MYKKVDGLVQLRGNLSSQHGCSLDPMQHFFSTTLDGVDKCKKLANEPAVYSSLQ